MKQRQGFHECRWQGDDAWTAVAEAKQRPTVEAVQTRFVFTDKHITAVSQTSEPENDWYSLLMAGDTKSQSISLTGHS